jgi:hypothetical protein
LLTGCGGTGGASRRRCGWPLIDGGGGETWMIRSGAAIETAGVATITARMVLASNRSKLCLRIGLKLHTLNATDKILCSAFTDDASRTPQIGLHRYYATANVRLRMK